jgi:hypothetical protein
MGDVTQIDMGDVTQIDMGDVTQMATRKMRATKSSRTTTEQSI